MLETKRLLTLWITVAVCSGVLLCVFLIMLPGQGAPAPTPTEPATTVAADPEPTHPTPPQSVFTPMDFDYEDEYLICLTHPSILGIDVSTFQKEIDWQQVRGAGVQFVMIRLGFRGFGQGDMEEDEWAQRNYRGAREAGLKVGGYFFSQAISIEEAVEEAEFALQIVKDWEMEMPLVFDWENFAPEHRTGNMDPRLLTDCAKAFCDTVEAAGYKSMIYFNPRQSESLLYLDELTDYGFWLAMYSDEMDYPHKVDMWQYTCTGSVPGINGNVDINLFFPYDDY